MRIQHILFPTDFSDLSKSTEAYVRRFAGHFGAKVTALHVIELPSGFYGMPGDYFFSTPDADTLRDRAMHTLDSVLPEMKAERLIRFGDPAAVIHEIAAANAVDLIMMPTHGYGPFRRALIGSVTAKTLHDNKCPVWTMAHTDRHEAGYALNLSRIICAIDLVPESAHVVRGAAELARSFGSQLWLAHAVALVHGFPEEYAASGQWALELQNLNSDRAREEIGKIQDETGTNFHVCVDAGPVSTVIADIARKHQADLVITGRGTVEHFLGTVRSHAYPIIHEAPCPVLSI